METQTQQLTALWLEARTRLTNQLENLTAEDLKKKLLPAPNSAGFLIRHIADVELLFAKNVFGNKEVKVVARTVIDGRDTGVWTNLDELKEYVEVSAQTLKNTISQMADCEWEMEISTKEFGIKTKAEALGRIISHTAYHAGQLAVIVKYGRPQ